jgi:hypothetical protein
LLASGAVTREDYICADRRLADMPGGRCMSCSWRVGWVHDMDSYTADMG